MTIGSACSYDFREHRVIVSHEVGSYFCHGPSIQNDLINIISRFRIHKYVISADIEKMYRQIWIADKDRDLQRILWRANPEDEVKEFRLKTVTYGTTPASYLATACLKKLADDSKPQFPNASIAVATDFYMDDYLGGAQTIDEAVKLNNEIVSITNAAGFRLRKRVSNDNRLLSGIPNEVNDPYLTWMAAPSKH
ncbi:hypothetical protein QTP88_026998 [Uroleucon formosanum]